jgi:hypothetical protein
MITVLPGVWLAWLHFVAVGAEVAGRDLTLQEATSTWAEQMPLTYLMARWSETCALAPGPVELPGGAADPRDVVRRFGEACIANRGGRRALGDLLAPLFEPESIAERVALARSIEPILGQLRLGSGNTTDRRRLEHGKGRGRKKRRR